MHYFISFDSSDESYQLGIIYPTNQQVLKEFEADSWEKAKEYYNNFLGFND